MIDYKNQISHYEIWKRFDELVDQMSDEDRRLCSYHKYYDAFIKAKHSEE